MSEHRSVRPIFLVAELARLAGLESLVLARLAQLAGLAILESLVLARLAQLVGLAGLAGLAILESLVLARLELRVQRALGPPLLLDTLNLRGPIRAV